MNLGVLFDVRYMADRSMLLYPQHGALDYQIYIHDQAFIRIGYMYNRLGLFSKDNSGVIDNIGFTQFYLPL